MSDLSRYRLCALTKTTPAAKFIYCYLLDLTVGDNSVVLSIRSLAKGVGLSRSATSRNLYRLKKLDMLRIISRYTEDGGRLSNQYVFR